MGNQIKAAGYGALAVLATAAAGIEWAAGVSTRDVGLTLGFAGIFTLWARKPV